MEHKHSKQVENKIWQEAFDRHGNKPINWKALGQQRQSATDANGVTWKDIESDDAFIGKGYELTKAPYRGRYETCICNEESAHRNRKWTVWFELDGKSHIVASGFCYGSNNAEQMILKAIELQL